MFVLFFIGRFYHPYFQILPITVSSTFTPRIWRFSTSCGHSPKTDITIFYSFFPLIHVFVIIQLCIIDTTGPILYALFLISSSAFTRCLTPWTTLNLSSISSNITIPSIILQLLQQSSAGPFLLTSLLSFRLERGSCITFHSSPIISSGQWLHWAFKLHLMWFYWEDVTSFTLANSKIKSFCEFHIIYYFFLVVNCFSNDFFQHFHWFIKPVFVIKPYLSFDCSFAPLTGCWLYLSNYSVISHCISFITKTS